MPKLCFNRSMKGFKRIVEDSPRVSRDMLVPFTPEYARGKVLPCPNWIFSIDKE